MSFGAGLNVGVRDGLSIAQFKHQRDNQNRRTRLAEAQFEYGKTRDRVADAQFQQQMQLNNERLVFSKKQHEENLAHNTRIEDRQQAKANAERARKLAANAITVMASLDAELGGDPNAIANRPEFDGIIQGYSQEGNGDFRYSIGHLAGLNGEVDDIYSTPDGFVARTADGKEAKIPNEIMVKAVAMNAARHGMMNETGFLRRMQGEGGPTITAEGLQALSQELNDYAEAQQPAPPQQTAPAQELYEDVRTTLGPENARQAPRQDDSAETAIYDNHPAFKVTAPLVKQVEQKAEKTKVGKLQLDNLAKTLNENRRLKREKAVSSASAYLALSRQNGVAPDMNTVHRFLSGDTRTEEQIAADKVELDLQTKLHEKRADAKNKAAEDRLTETYKTNRALLENAANDLAIKIYNTPEPTAEQVKALESDMYQVALSSEFANVIDMNDFFAADNTKFVAAISAVSDAIQKNKALDNDLANNQIPTVTIPDSLRDTFKTTMQKGGALEGLAEEDAGLIFQDALKAANGDVKRAIQMIIDSRDAN